jgi:hypothetical protein
LATTGSEGRAQPVARRVAGHADRRLVDVDKPNCNGAEGGAWHGRGERDQLCFNRQGVEIAGLRMDRRPLA